MAIIYYPKSSIITRRDTVSASFEETLLNVYPSNIFFFDSSSNLSVLSSSVFSITSSWSNNVISSSFSVSASYLLNKVAMTSSHITFADSGSNPLAINSSRIQWSIQNLDVLPLYLKFGTNCDSSSLSGYDMILIGGTSLDDGYGQRYDDNGMAVWGGAVSVTGSSIRYICSERY